MESRKGEKTQKTGEARKPVVITAKGKTDEEVLEQLKQKAVKELIPRLVSIQTMPGGIKIGPAEPGAMCNCSCHCKDSGSGAGEGAG